MSTEASGRMGVGRRGRFRIALAMSKPVLSAVGTVPGLTWLCQVPGRPLAAGRSEREPHCLRGGKPEGPGGSVLLTRGTGMAGRGANAPGARYRPLVSRATAQTAGAGNPTPFPAPGKTADPGRVATRNTRRSRKRGRD